MKKCQYIFDANESLHDLKGKSVRAGSYAMAAEAVSQVLRVGSMIILARLLLPEHFGLVSMVTALTLFAERLKHLGLSTVTIQQKGITHEQVSVLFWINASVGVLIGLFITGLSPAIASFYQQPSLVAVASGLSLSFVFGGLAVQHEALLRRQMRFRELAWVQGISILLSSLLGIGLAVSGYTYWALIWKEVAKSAFEAIGVWIACRWWPSLPARVSGIRPLLQTGRNVVSTDIAYFLSRSADQLLLGKFAGASSLGLYKQAFQLMSLPMSLFCSPVGHAALPSLSALQDHPDRYQRYYVKILALLSFISIPLASYVAIFSEDIIDVILGSNWSEAAGILRILALAALIEPLYSTYSVVMITMKETQRLLSWTLLYALTLVAGFAIGIHWGAMGVAAGYTIVNYLLMIPSLWFGFKGSPISIKMFFQTISMPVSCSIIMAVALLTLSHGTASWESVPRIGLSLLVALIAYLGLWVVLPGGRRRLFDDASYLFSIVKPSPGVAR